MLHEILAVLVIPAGSCQAKTVLGARLTSKHLLFSSVDKATSYYQRHTIPSPEVQVPKNSNYSNYVFFFSPVKVILGVVAGNANVCVYRFLLIRAINDKHFTRGGTLEFESSDYGAPLLIDFATLVLKGVCTLL